MSSILITGCNRGIGLGLVKKLLSQTNPPKHLIATCRDITKAEELQDIARKNKNVHILNIDLQNFNDYNKFGKEINSIVGEDGLNLLINNAGVASKFTRLSLVKPDQLSEAFTTNTIAPIMLTKELYPALKKAALKNANTPMGICKAAVINMSSILGSVSNNTDGGYYPYRCSKAALNMATKSMSADFKNDQILVIALHPGWVRTDMGGNKAPLDVDECTTDIVKLLYDLKEQHNGTYLQHDGGKLTW